MEMERGLVYSSYPPNATECMSKLTTTRGRDQCLPLSSVQKMSIEASMLRGLVPFTYEDLLHFTNNFSEQNYICKAHFGKVYRGRIPNGWKDMAEQDVTVKIWDDLVFKRRSGRLYVASEDYMISKFQAEIRFLSQPDVVDHPNLVKLKGYCDDVKHLGVVYDLKPLDSLHCLICDDSFRWLDRVKVALKLALLLKFLHSHQTQYLVRDLSDWHILLEQDLNPVLYDFGMLSAGVTIENDPNVAGIACMWAQHLVLDVNPMLTGCWTENVDIFSFGLILLELIGKCTYHGWKRDYVLDGYVVGKKEFSCAHSSFEDEHDFDSVDGFLLTSLARQCLLRSSRERPKMKEITEKMQNLHIFCRESEKQAAELSIEDCRRETSKHSGFLSRFCLKTA